MSVSILRRMLCWTMMVIFPSSLLAADAQSAILHTQGGVWVNGNEAPDATAIVPGDLLETKAGSAANLTTDGSSIVIQAESVVKYNGDSLTLEHGGVSVGTSKAFTVHVDCLRVVPVSNEWTQYDVTHVNDSVRVAALKLDVNILRGASTRKPSPETTESASATVHEGQQVSRDASQACGAANRPTPATNPLNAKWIKIGAGAGGGVLLCLLLCTPPKAAQMSQSAP